jgi:hypothetical protein
MREKGREGGREDMDPAAIDDRCCAIAKLNTDNEERTRIGDMKGVEQNLK